MLVLERTVNSAIRIGSDIRITVVEIPSRTRVRLGLDVPGGTLIWREELAIGHQAKPAVQQKIELDVVIVEDDPAHARLIEKAFTRAGAAKTTIISDPLQALPQLRGRTESGVQLPKLVILDLRLPGSSGLEILKEIRNDTNLKGLPVVMLSGIASDNDVTACLEAGANAFLAKTDDYQEFCNLVIRIAEFWRHHRG